MNSATATCCCATLARNKQATEYLEDTRLLGTLISSAKSTYRHSVSQPQIVAGHTCTGRLGLVVLDDRDEFVDQFTGVGHIQLLIEEGKFVFQGLVEACVDRVWQVPQFGLERAHGLFARLVVELRVGLAGFALVGRSHVQELVDLVGQVCREGSVVQEDVHEAGRQVDFQRLDFRELVEHFLGQGAGAMLHGATGAKVAGAVAQHLEGVKIDGDLGDAAVGQHDAAVACAGLDADLAQAAVLPKFLECLRIALHVGIQLFGRRVFLAHFADLAAQADRHAGGFQITDVLGDFGGALVVVLLLLVQRFAAPG